MAKHKKDGTGAENTPSKVRKTLPGPSQTDLRSFATPAEREPDPLPRYSKWVDLVKQESRAYYGARKDKFYGDLWERVQKCRQHPHGARFEQTNLVAGRLTWTCNPKETCDKFDVYLEGISKRGVPLPAKAAGSAEHAELAAVEDVAETTTATFGHFSPPLSLSADVADVPEMEPAGDHAEAPAVPAKEETDELTTLENDNVPAETLIAEHLGNHEPEMPEMPEETACLKNREPDMPVEEDNRELEPPAAPKRETVCQETVCLDNGELETQAICLNNREPEMPVEEDNHEPEMPAAVEQETVCKDNREPDAPVELPDAIPFTHSKVNVPDEREIDCFISRLAMFEISESNPNPKPFLAF